MLTELNTVEMIRNEFPALPYPQTSDTTVKQLFRSVRNLADYTKEQLRKNNEFEIEHCFRVAHEILMDGSNSSKQAIESIYIYSVSRVLEISFAVSANVRQQFLKFFKNEYCQLINAAHP